MGRSASNISTSVSGGLHDFVSKTTKGFVTINTIDSSSYNISNLYELLRQASSDNGYLLPSIFPPAKSGLVIARFDGLPNSVDEQELLSVLGNKIEASNLRDSSFVETAPKAESSLMTVGKTVYSSPTQDYPSAGENGSKLKGPSRLRGLKRRLNGLLHRCGSGYHQRRLRKGHAFLILWIGAFFVGLLVAPMNVLVLTLVSLTDALILFIPLSILWWLFHKRVAGKIFAIFLVLIFAAYVYQTPSSFTKSNLKYKLGKQESGLRKIGTGWIIERRCTPRLWPLAFRLLFWQSL
jgi:hypothetical protein